MPMWNKIFVQNSNSPLMEHLSFFHDHSMIILISMTIITLLIMFSCLYYNNFNRFFLEVQTLELFWTSLPALMLIFIAFPSLKTLYLMEENLNPLLSIKTMGLQWYWTYEYFNLSNSKFNSLLLNSNLIRLLNSSSNLIIPNLIPTRMLISSKDVIHSWTIPSLGVKSDAMPGRMNQIFLMIKRPTILVGQCSEICGAGHSFMPILLEVNSNKNFMKML